MLSETLKILFIDLKKVLLAQKRICDGSKVLAY